MSVGNSFPIVLDYFYNDHQSMEKLPNGTINSFYDPRIPADSVTTPLSSSDYSAGYSDFGLPKTGYFSHSNQYLGRTNRYWRHSFDNILIDRSSTAGFYTYSRFDGVDITFDLQGKSAVYPDLSLEALTVSEVSQLGFSGRKLIDYNGGTTSYFDERGRLARVKNRQNLYHQIEYNTNDTLHRIAHSLGGHIEFTYSSYPIKSIYSVTPGEVEYYPVMFTDQEGRKVNVEWSKSHPDQLVSQQLITRISHEYVGNNPTSARDYVYGQVGFWGALSAIYDVENIGLNIRTLYAQAKYDLKGRAILSELAGGKERISVDYTNDNQRKVTNALGKQATYTFADYNGVKRLHTVTGVPTQNCVASEVEYQYFANGNVQRKIQNDQVTEYQYDNQNRETSRTEATGTPAARTILTEYHLTLNLPVRITEPGKVTVMTYDASGRLLTQNIQSTTP